MDYILIALLSFGGGFFAMYIVLDSKRKELKRRQGDLDQQSQRYGEQLAEIQKNAAQINETSTKLDAEQRELDTRAISYADLQNENGLLKRDLRNLAINVRKFQLDDQLREQGQAAINEKVEELGSRYLKENIKWISNSLTQSNFAASKQRLLDTIERCRTIGLHITDQDEASYLAELRVEYEKVVRAAFEREEQARIKAQIREEQQLLRDIQREQERVTRERIILEAALAKAVAEAHDQFSLEIEQLKAKLAANDEKQRALSQAQLTKAGFVYVISNIGSFGEGVFKIGMTRRLEPLDRVRELGDASVPFPFDVHLMVSCTDAPKLENAIHKKLLHQQVNRTNPRKEFFRTDLDTIVQIVKGHHGDVQYVADAEALQYRQSLTMSAEDQEFIEHVFDELENEDPAFGQDLSHPVASE